MSFSISLNTFPTAPDLPDPTARAAKPLPQPTSTQQMHQLESAGEIVPQIAANLGLPVATVDSTLGYSISTTPQAGSAQASILTVGAAALTPRLDTKA